MATKVAILSIGIPDPTQGGSGIFNYYVVRELLRRGCDVHALFRVNQVFLKGHTVKGYLKDLSDAGLKYDFVQEAVYGHIYDTGYDLIRKLHQLQACKAAVDEFSAMLGQVDACISLDLGWALAIKHINASSLYMLGDPVHERMRHGRPYPLWKPSALKSWIQMRSLDTDRTWSKLAAALNGKTLGSFSPHHAQYYREKGIVCRDYRWFSAEVDKPAVDAIRLRADRLRILHVGGLETTASKNMLEYWSNELFPMLSNLDFAIDIMFVGRGSADIASEWKNIDIRYMGYEDDLGDAFAQADVFLSPMKYPVGTRTRIITALSYGVPVIADSTAALGLPELSDGEDILYADDAGEICERLALVYSDPPNAQKIGEQARRAWEKHYNPVKNVHVLLEAVGL